MVSPELPADPKVRHQIPAPHAKPADNIQFLLDQAFVPPPLRSKPPLTWSQGDVSLWLCSLFPAPSVSLAPEDSPSLSLPGPPAPASSPGSAFALEQVDGMSLFDLSEDDLRPLLPTLGPRKKFLRARTYIATAFNIPTQEAIMLSLERTQREQARFGGSMDEEEGDDEDGDGVPAIVRDKSGAQKDVANLPEFQRKEFVAIRNVSGGISLGLEVILNMLNKVHPAAHLAVLLPGGLAGMMSYALKKRI